MHLLIITPIFPPTTGGSATYYGLLVDRLLASGRVSRISVITERVPGCPTHELRVEGRCVVMRMFPHRAGRYLGPAGLIFRYAVQNLQYALLPRIVSELKPDLLLVHSSVHIYFNTLTPLIRYFARRFPVVADVRDHQLTPSRLHQLKSYSALIVCSQNVLAHIAKLPALVAKASLIPVLQERLSREHSCVRRTLRKYGLQDRRYLLFAGLLKKAKGVDLLLDTLCEVRNRGSDLELALVGLSKDESLTSRARATPAVHMLGPVPRHELLDLMSAAAINVNLSTSEGMPRTSLEALALGTKVLLPSGIPEFDAFCRHAVVRSRSPVDVADQIQELLRASADNGYPIANHDIDNGITKYLRLFDSLLGKRSVSV